MAIIISERRVDAYYYTKKNLKDLASVKNIFRENSRTPIKIYVYETTNQTGNHPVFMAVMNQGEDYAFMTPSFLTSEEEKDILKEFIADHNVEDEEKPEFITIHLLNGLQRELYFSAIPREVRNRIEHRMH